MLRGDWFEPNERFTIPDHHYKFTQEISEKPLIEYYRADYQFFIKRALSRHSILDKKTLWELSYVDYDEELSWITIAERYILSLYYELTK